MSFLSQGSVPVQRFVHKSTAQVKSKNNFWETRPEGGKWMYLGPACACIVLLYQTLCLDDKINRKKFQSLRDKKSEFTLFPLLILQLLKIQWHLKLLIPLQNLFEKNSLEFPCIWLERKNQKKISSQRMTWVTKNTV